MADADNQIHHPLVVALGKLQIEYGQIIGRKGKIKEKYDRQIAEIMAGAQKVEEEKNAAVARIEKHEKFIYSQIKSIEALVAKIKAEGGEMRLDNVEVPTTSGSGRKVNSDPEYMDPRLLRTVQRIVTYLREHGATSFSTLISEGVVSGWSLADLITNCRGAVVSFTRQREPGGLGRSQVTVLDLSVNAKIGSQTELGAKLQAAVDGTTESKEVK